MATTLTDREIRAAKCPDHLNQITLRDNQPRGLVLRVYRSEVKTWHVAYRRKEDNKRRYPKIGTYPSVSLKKARELAEVELGREVAKNGESNRVPLSPQALRVLDQLRPYTGGSEWVLESPCKPGFHLTTIKTANNGILARTGMRHWTPHDLRRTAASKMSAMGTDRRVLQAILNHKDHSVTAIYDRYGMDREKCEALTRWGERVEQLTDGGASGAVVDFPDRRALRVAAS